MSRRRGMKWRRLQKRVIARDGLECFWCGCECERPGAGKQGQLEPHHATIDHLIPVARGGSDRLSNLVVACHSCNSTRGDGGTFDERGRGLQIPPIGSLA